MSPPTSPCLSRTGSARSTCGARTGNSLGSLPPPAATLFFCPATWRTVGRMDDATAETLARAAGLGLAWETHREDVKDALAVVARNRAALPPIPDAGIEPRK